MKFAKVLLGLGWVLIAVCGCSSGSSSSGLANGTSLPPMSGDNVLPLTVNGTECSSNSYVNKPCVSVKVCSPGTSTCQTINDLLLDTGSVGLRVFKSVLTVTLTQVTVSSNELAECVQFADGSSDWGPVQTADVVLGNEPAVTVPIQVIDSTYATAPTECSSPDTSPATAGFNGILGVGSFLQDCGSTCLTKTLNKRYFSCSGATCSYSTAALAKQVSHPVAALPTDNNGVILRLPSVNLGGTTSASGYLVLGIGTESNNAPSGVTTFPLDPTYAEFKTSFNGTSYSGIIDSGSNGNFFTGTSSLTDCGSSNSSYSGLFCPSSNVSLSATNSGYAGTPSGALSFYVGNFISLASSTNFVFSEMGGSATGFFDWGLPFHLGRNVYVGIESQTSSLGTGPYWAY